MNVFVKSSCVLRRLVVMAVCVLAIVGTSATAQAVTIFQDENAKVDLYSRLYLVYENTDSSRVIGDGSRLGIRASHRISEGLSAFARAEFRYDASQRERNTVFNDRRNTYVGLDSQFGRLTVGNFDSVYYQAVSHQLDIFQNPNYGFVAIGQGGTASRRDSVAYASPVLHGFQVHGQVCHYDKGDSASGKSEVIPQAGATFTIKDLTLGAAAVFKNRDVGFNENLIGVSAQYKVLDNLSLRVLYEHQKNDATRKDYHMAAGAIFTHGKISLYGSLGQDRDKRGYVSVGTSYRIGRPMRAFVEYCNGNPIHQDNVIAAGLRYDF